MNFTEVADLYEKTDSSTEAKEFHNTADISLFTPDYLDSAISFFQKKRLELIKSEDDLLSCFSIMVEGKSVVLAETKRIPEFFPKANFLERNDFVKQLGSDESVLTQLKRIEDSL